MISLVIRKHRKHITRADYRDTPVHLDLTNVEIPQFNTLEGRTLRRLFPAAKTLSHRDFDRVSRSYRLGGFIDKLRDKGWPIVNHDEVARTSDVVPRNAKFTRYELFATFTPELLRRVHKFCADVDKFEAEAAATTSADT